MENTPLNNDSAINHSQINDRARQSDVSPPLPREMSDHQIGHEPAFESQNISLLEEKLVVKRQKRKLGEVVVRKEVETRMLHIPIRREKLIVEKIGTTTEHLTEVNLRSEEVNGVKIDELGDAKNIYQAQTNFVSLSKAQELLDKIIKSSTRGNTKIRLEIISDNCESQQTYLDLCD